MRACARREERYKRAKKTERERERVLMDGSMKVMAPSVSSLFVAGSRDSLGKQSRNKALVRPAPPPLS